MWAMGDKAREILEKAARRAARVQQTTSPEDGVSPRPGFLRSGAHIEFCGFRIFGTEIIVWLSDVENKSFHGPTKGIFMPTGALLAVLID